MVIGRLLYVGITLKILKALSYLTPTKLSQFLFYVDIVTSNHLSELTLSDINHYAICRILSSEIAKKVLSGSARIG